MATITIILPDEHLLKLQEAADKLGLKPEELMRVSIEELLNRPEEVFQQTVEYILKKNVELYRRLA